MATQADQDSPTMSTNRSSLASLPAEIHLQIVSNIEPRNEVRTLRHLIKATTNTDAHIVAECADSLLEAQKQSLLKKWVAKEAAKDACDCAGPKERAAIARLYIGKQYVSEAEDTKGDKWAFKKSQLPTDLVMTSSQGISKSGIGPILYLKVEKKKEVYSASEARVVLRPRQQAIAAGKLREPQGTRIGWHSDIRLVGTRARGVSMPSRPKVNGCGGVCTSIDVWQAPGEKELVKEFNKRG
ncbi:hypothetical protein PMZ80_010734 [Knufia obscura]|uniref:F-box protein n=1 Tax=Knufia obscura TaxID=1635080 RepID=A0ABR0R8M8_9EURO|nr:hypothetical protein PMZ80_010734 [Knufia obscura]